MLNHFSYSRQVGRLGELEQTHTSAAGLHRAAYLVNVQQELFRVESLVIGVLLDQFCLLGATIELVQARNYFIRRLSVGREA